MCVHARARVYAHNLAKGSQLVCSLMPQPAAWRSRASAHTLPSPTHSRRKRGHTRELADLMAATTSFSPLCEFPVWVHLV